MSRHLVLFDITLLLGAIFTIAAFERLFVAVNKHMCLQMNLLITPVIAKMTSKRFFVGMRKHMSSKVPRVIGLI